MAIFQFENFIHALFKKTFPNNNLETLCYKLSSVVSRVLLDITKKSICRILCIDNKRAKIGHFQGIRRALSVHKNLHREATIQQEFEVACVGHVSSFGKIENVTFGEAHFLRSGNRPQAEVSN